MDVIRNADWLIDLGPEGGEEGGKIVAQGTPEQVSKIKKSYTGQALALTLKNSVVRALPAKVAAEISLPPPTRASKTDE
jgi:excinuclease ABC subunit A